MYLFFCFLLSIVLCPVLQVSSEWTSPLLPTNTGNRPHKNVIRNKIKKDKKCKSDINQGGKKIEKGRNIVHILVTGVLSLLAGDPG
jgi:hypothetical protein